MTGLKELQPIRFDEFESMEKQESLNYELIDGIVMMSPRPSKEHQDISGNLYFELRNTLKSDCKPILEVDLVLDENNFIPDLMVICNDELKGKRHEKAPLIVIEIISPSSASHDYFVKRLKYEQLGIPEYWIVSPEEKCIMVIAFERKQQERYCEGRVTSFTMPDLQIDLNKIFT